MRLNFRKRMKRFYLSVFVGMCLVSHVVVAQGVRKEVPRDWFLLDPQQDSVQGLSVEKAYNTILKDQPSKSVLVAVIDSGIDIDHEDLKDVIWTNPGEIAGNGIDDDKNGYIDDVHGWNFIGGKNGNVDADTYELTREYMRLSKKYENSKYSYLQIFHTHGAIYNCYRNHALCTKYSYKNFYK